MNAAYLGSGALAGHAFGLNRQEVALELRFAGTIKIKNLRKIFLKE